MNPFRSFDRRSAVVSLVAILVIAASTAWTWHRHFRRPPFETALHQGIGEALADRVRTALDGKGRILVVLLESGESPVLDAQWHAFQAALAGSPNIEITDRERIDSGQKSKYGPGTGLSASRLLRLVAKNRKVDAIVSFVGLPELEPKELEELGTRGPRLIAFTRNAKKLGPLLAAGRLEAAVVPRFEFPAPLQNPPRTPSEWFALRFQWIAATDLAPSR